MDKKNQIDTSSPNEHITTRTLTRSRFRDQTYRYFNKLESIIHEVLAAIDEAERGVVKSKVVELLKHYDVVGLYRLNASDRGEVNETLQQSSPDYDDHKRVSEGEQKSELKSSEVTVDVFQPLFQVRDQHSFPEHPLDVLKSGGNHV